MGAGNFSISFTQEYTPTAVIESIKEWGHIVITPQAVDVTSLSDADILSSATYTGIVLNRTLEEGVVSVNGQGLELYLGDGKGKVGFGFGDENYATIFGIRPLPTSTYIQFSFNEKNNMSFEYVLPDLFETDMLEKGIIITYGYRF